MTIKEVKEKYKGQYAEVNIVAHRFYGDRYAEEPYRWLWNFIEFYDDRKIDQDSEVLDAVLLNKETYVKTLLRKSGIKSSGLLVNGKRLCIMLTQEERFKILNKELEDELREAELL